MDFVEFALGLDIYKHLGANSREARHNIPPAPPFSLPGEEVSSVNIGYIWAAQRMHVQPDKLFAFGAISSHPQLSFTYVRVYAWSVNTHVLFVLAAWAMQERPKSGVSTDTRISVASEAPLSQRIENARYHKHVNIAGPLYACEALNRCAAHA